MWRGPEILEVAQSFASPLSFLLKNGEGLSPAAATTAEEAMSVSPEPRASSRDVRVVPGDLGGTAALGSDAAVAGAEGGSEESAQESEAWAAAVPPVRAPQLTHTHTHYS